MEYAEKLSKALKEYVREERKENISAITVSHQSFYGSVAIFDSVRMMFYGIGLDKKFGFTVCITITNRSITGKKLISEIEMNNHLNEYMRFVHDKATVFVLDCQL